MGEGGTAVAEITAEGIQPPLDPSVVPEPDPTPVALPIQTAIKVRRGSLLLKDSLLFLTLSAIAAALFGVTYLLHRSFESHRTELGREWSERGRQALAAGHPHDAVSALRASLGYLPDQHENQLLLAEALAAEGRTDEATTYFLNLWEQQPGDGYINLQLARLSRGRGDSRKAVTYYEAALNGAWQGDGAQRRRRVRLELSDYLASRHEMQAARSELLIAAGNAPENESYDLIFGDRLKNIGDTEDALHFYEKAMTDDPHDHIPSERAGRLALDAGDYNKADELLNRALRQMPEDLPALRKHEPNAKQLREQYLQERNALIAEEAEAHRLAELNLTHDQPAVERAAHLEAVAAIVRARLATCSATQASHENADLKAIGLPIRLVPSGGPDVGTSQQVLDELTARWKTASRSLRGVVLAHDAEAQDTLAQLIADTEIRTAGICGAPTGDNALILRLVRSQRFIQGMQMERP